MPGLIDLVRSNHLGAPDFRTTRASSSEAGVYTLGDPCPFELSDRGQYVEL